MESTDPKNKRYDSKVDHILDPGNDTPIEDDIQKFYDKIRNEVDDCHQRKKQWHNNATTEQKKQRAESEYSDKGEHVINESIIELEEGIIKEIMRQKYHYVSDRALERAEQILKKSLAPNRTSGYESAEEFIAHTTAMYTYRDFYYDTNGALYKALLLLLRRCARNYFWCIYCKEDAEKRKRYTQALNKTIHLIIEEQIFVDTLALETFISQTTSSNRKEAQKRYDHARKMVQSKFFELAQKLKDAAEKLQEN